MKQIDLQIAKLLVTTYDDAQTNLYNDRYDCSYVDGINKSITTNYINKMEEL